jgi:hypothetical protein
MKTFLLFTLFVCSAMAADIPVDKFDQSKLLVLLKRIPEAHIEQEDKGKFMRQHFLFAPEQSAFSIRCSADFYQNASYPSEHRCKLTVSDTASRQGDEYLLELTDPAAVQSLWSAISYGTDAKKLYATERISGISYEGRQRQLFRYAFVCTQLSCRMTFAAH